MVVFAGILIAEANPIVGVLDSLARAFVPLIAGRGTSNRRAVVLRPISEATAFSAPPLPDTVVVRCEFCGTTQPFREKCVQCGAPLPRP